MTTCAFQLPFGKLYRIFSPKWTFMVSLFVFEIGSLVCAVAPHSIALIIGVGRRGIHELVWYANYWR